MTILQPLALELGEKCNGVVKQAFWALISRLAEYQKLHPELYGQIEHELEWVDISHFESAPKWPSAEERWLQEIVIHLESSASGVAGKAYVIPFRGSLPGEVVYYDRIPQDVFLIRVHGAEPYHMFPLRDEHVLAQYWCSHLLAQPPEERKVMLQPCLQVVSVSDSLLLDHP